MGFLFGVRQVQIISRPQSSKRSTIFWGFSEKQQTNPALSKSLGSKILFGVNPLREQINRGSLQGYQDYTISKRFPVNLSDCEDETPGVVRFFTGV